MATMIPGADGEHANCADLYSYEVGWPRSSISRSFDVCRPVFEVESAMFARDLLCND